MSSVLPKEQQSAYQRWEMASFGDDRPSQAKRDRDAAAANSASDAVSAARAEQQIASALEQARLEGYAIGLEQGRSTGLEQGRAQAAQEQLHLQRLGETFGAEMAQADEVIAQDMLDLALDIAKAMLKTTLAVRPERVVPIVSEAIRYLPSLQQPALLFVNPEDALLVRRQIGEELAKAGWRIVEEAQLERGGCRIETASNQIDASAPTRWQRIAAALGKESDWLE
jgi:flagellar assembly protein FliH